MTETKGRYNVKPVPGAIRGSCFDTFDQDTYTQPTPEEVRELINRIGLSGNQVAALVGASSGRVVRKWQAAGDVNNKANIPYAAWRLLVLEFYKQGLSECNQRLLSADSVKEAVK